MKISTKVCNHLPMKPLTRFLRTKVRATLTTVLATALIGPAVAQKITYVDATHGTNGNTVVAPSAGGGVFNPAGAIGTQGPGGDGLWDLRAFGNNATIYQNASAGNVDNAQRLATTVTGLSLNTYNVYAFFWSDTSSWRMGAALNSDPAGPLTLNQANPTTPGVVQYYTGGDATFLSSSLAVNPFATGVMVGEGNRRLYGISLGTVTGAGFTVVIDDSPAQADQNQRTWYDGVGYSVVPEPSSVALFAVAGLGLLLTRIGRQAKRRVARPVPTPVVGLPR